MAIDPYSINFKTNGMYKRVLEMMNGNEQLASDWWVTPNVNLNLRTPLQQMDIDWTEVRELVFRQKRNSGFDTNVGQTDGWFIKDASVNENLTGFTSEHHHSYHYDYKTRAAEFYMKSMRTSIGSISKVYRANKGLESGLIASVRYIDTPTGRVRAKKGRNSKGGQPTEGIIGPPNQFK